jgi:sulfite reductase alpha subunit-like flavoprotein
VNEVVASIVSPPNFSLPKDPAAPIIMFAGGTGKSPTCGSEQHTQNFSTCICMRKVKISKLFIFHFGEKELGI